MLVVNGCTTLLLYFVGGGCMGDRRSDGGGQLRLAFDSEAVLGLSGHATHFVVLLAVPGICCCSQRGSESAKLYLRPACAWAWPW